MVNQYRHCKTILALGCSSTLLDKAGISATLPNGEADGGLLLMKADEDRAGKRFIAAVSKHRHPERESDPPLV